MPQIIQSIPPLALQKLAEALETFNASISPGNPDMVMRIEDVSVQGLKALKSVEISGCDALLRLIKDQPKPLPMNTRRPIPQDLS